MSDLYQVLYGEDKPDFSLNTKTLTARLPPDIYSHIEATSVIFGMTRADVVICLLHGALRGVQNITFDPKTQATYEGVYSLCFDRIEGDQNASDS